MYPNGWSVTGVKGLTVIRKDWVALSWCALMAHGLSPVTCAFTKFVVLVCAMA